ncbi:MAG: hypothetical protein ABIG71_04690, partial [Candidatus Uhrbacteria bacterium]
MPTHAPESASERTKPEFDVFAEKKALFARIEDGAERLSESNRRALVYQMLRASVEDGMDLARRFALTPREIADGLSRRFALMHPRFANRFYEYFESGSTQGKLTDEHHVLVERIRDRFMDVDNLSEKEREDALRFPTEGPPWSSPPGVLSDEADLRDAMSDYYARLLRARAQASPKGIFKEIPAEIPNEILDRSPGERAIVDHFQYLRPAFAEEYYAGNLRAIIDQLGKKALGESDQDLIRLHPTITPENADWVLSNAEVDTSDPKVQKLLDRARFRVSAEVSKVGERLATKNLHDELKDSLALRGYNPAHLAVEWDKDAASTVVKYSPPPHLASESAEVREGEQEGVSLSFSPSRREGELEGVGKVTFTAEDVEELYQLFIDLGANPGGRSRVERHLSEYFRYRDNGQDEIAENYFANSEAQQKISELYERRKREQETSPVAKAVEFADEDAVELGKIFQRIDIDKEVPEEAQRIARELLKEAAEAHTPDEAKRIVADKGYLDEIAEKVLKLFERRKKVWDAVRAIQFTESDVQKFQDYSLQQFEEGPVRKKWEGAQAHADARSLLEDWRDIHAKESKEHIEQLTALGGYRAMAESIYLERKARGSSDFSPSHREGEVGGVGKVDFSRKSYKVEEYELVANDPERNTPLGEMSIVGGMPAGPRWMGRAEGDEDRAAGVFVGQSGSERLASRGVIGGLRRDSGNGRFVQDVGGLPAFIRASDDNREKQSVRWMEGGTTRHSDGYDHVSWVTDIGGKPAAVVEEEPPSSFYDRSARSHIWRSGETRDAWYRSISELTDVGGKLAAVIEGSGASVTVFWDNRVYAWDFSIDSITHLTDVGGKPCAIVERSGKQMLWCDGEEKFLIPSGVVVIKIVDVGGEPVVAYRSSNGPEGWLKFADRSVKHYKNINDVASIAGKPAVLFTGDGGNEYVSWNDESHPIPITADKYNIEFKTDKRKKITTLYVIEQDGKAVRVRSKEFPVGEADEALRQAQGIEEEEQEGKVLNVASEELTESERKKLVLLNVMHSVHEGDWPNDQRVAFIDVALRKDKSPSRSITEELREDLSGSRVFARAMNERLQEDPTFARALLRTMPAVPDPTDRAAVERIARQIFPELAQNEQQSGLLQRFCGFFRGGEYPPAVMPTSPADYLRSDGVEQISDGDPRELNPREIARFRESFPMSQFLTTSVLGKYNPASRNWRAVDIPLALTANESTRAMTGELQELPSGAAVRLPIGIGGKVGEGGALGYSGPPPMEKEEGRSGTPLEVIRDTAGAVARLPMNERVGSIVYTQYVPELPPVLSDVSSRVYDTFKKRLTTQLGNEDFEASIGALFPEFDVFLASIKDREPRERIESIERFVRDVGYYDFDNREVQALKRDVSFTERLRIMRERMEQLKERASGSSPSSRGGERGGVAEQSLNDKQLAGICADFNLLTTALLRRSGVLAGCMRGFVLPAG